MTWSLFRITTEIKTTYEKFVRFAQNRGEQFYPTAFVTYRISHIYRSWYLTYTYPLPNKYFIFKKILYNMNNYLRGEDDDTILQNLLISTLNKLLIF